MKYEIYVRFWGYSDLNVFHANDAKIRDRIIKELKECYSITYISYNKIYKNGTKVPVKSEIIG